jgi:Cd2+/Zn2+-exporting ATPase
MIIEGNSNINQATITGESIPVDKKTGDEVFAGTLNGNGVLKLKVHQPPESSLIQRIIRLVEQAQTEAPPSQQFIERFERGYARVIVLVGLLLMILPPLWLGWNWETTIYRALIFLVVASPCALMASIMPTLLSGIARGAREGILYKNGAQLEKMGKVRAIAFDKTGTLTAGKLQVTEIIPVAGYSENQVLQLAAALESRSEHPIGEAIALAAKERNLSWQEAVNVRAEVGRGIVGEVAGKKVLVGKATFIRQQVSHFPPELVEISDRLDEINTLVWVAQADGAYKPCPRRAGSAPHKVIGLIAVADTIRPESARLIKQLKQLNIEQIVLLTGDNQRTANSVAQSLGIDEVYAEVLPEDKLTVIKHLKQKYQNVAMVGDGINDAPALAAATVGIAMGGAGNDVALETADIVLMSDRLEKLSRAITLGRRTNRIVKQNITFALSFICLLLLANFAGTINMPLGVIGHEGSTVLVTLSGLRLLK